MTFLELRDRLVREMGFSRKSATLGIRWAKGLETEASLFRDFRWMWIEGESNMSHKVSGLGARHNIESVRELVRMIL
jgi:hypothetical protein